VPGELVSPFLIDSCHRLLKSRREEEKKERRKIATAGEIAFLPRGPRELTQLQGKKGKREEERRGRSPRRSASSPPLVKEKKRGKKKWEGE